MAYVKIIYQNSPSTATPINAENLNHMDDQIALNDQRLTEIETSYVKSFNGRKGEVTPQANDYNMSQITPTNGATVGQIPIVRNDGTVEEPNLTFHMEDVPSSGHVIQNASGTDMAQENAMQFADAFVSNDSVNGRTVVENIKEVSPADYDSTTDEGIIVCDDGNDAVIGAVSNDKVEVVADGDKTYGQLLNELYALIDISKISAHTKLVIDVSTYYLAIKASNYLRLFYCQNFSDQFIINCITLQESNSDCKNVAIKSSGNTVSDDSSYVFPNGTVLTLYYGNKKATVDLQTTANRCLYDSENTVKQKLDLKLQGFRDTVTIPAISPGQNGSITVPFTGDLPYSVSFIANQSGKCFVASNYWTDGTNLNVSVYSAQGTSGETALINVIY